MNDVWIEGAWFDETHEYNEANWGEMHRLWKLLQRDRARMSGWVLDSSTANDWVVPLVSLGSVTTDSFTIEPYNDEYTPSSRAVLTHELLGALGSVRSCLCPAPAQSPEDADADLLIARQLGYHGGTT